MTSSGRVGIARLPKSALAEEAAITRGGRRFCYVPRSRRRLMFTHMRTSLRQPSVANPRRERTASQSLALYRCANRASGKAIRHGDSCMVGFPQGRRQDRIGRRRLPICRPGRPFDRDPRFRAPAGIGRSVLPLDGQTLLVAGISLRGTPEGRWFCCEVNPSVGFTVCPQATGRRIAEAIVDLLAVGRRSMRLDRLA